MQLTIDRDKLLQSCNFASAAAGKSPGFGAQHILPYGGIEVGGVRMVAEKGRLSMTCAGEEMTIVARTDASVSKTGEATVNARMLTQIARSLPEGDALLSCKDHSMELACGTARFALRVMPQQGGLHGQVSEPNAEPLSLDAENLWTGLEQVLPAASQDAARPILTAVMLGQEDGHVRLVATDSYRIAVKDLEGLAPLSDKQALLPGGAVKTLLKLVHGREDESLPVECKIGSAPADDGDGDEIKPEHRPVAASFQVESTKLTCRLIEGDFPNYKGLMPSKFTGSFGCDKEEFTAAVKRVQIMAAADGGPVRLTADSGVVTLRSKTTDIGDGEDQFPAETSGSMPEMGFNPKFLLQALEACVGPEVKMSTQDKEDGTKPVQIESPESGPDFKSLVMPYRLS